MESKKLDATPNLQGMEVKITTWVDPCGIELRARQREEILAIYPDDPGPPPSADNVPVFIVLKMDGIPVACGGLRPISGERHPMAEIKRMYVLPECRGKSKGIADMLLQQLELQAVQNGWRILRLETGTDMAQARAFYRKHGYNEIPLFGGYVESTWSVCYEKSL